MTLTPKPTDLLVLIDIQNDFLPGGALAVPDGDAILPRVAELVGQFENIALTQDWHPMMHWSFAANHDGRAPFTEIDMDYGKQMLWPTHCVIGTRGAQIALPAEVTTRADLLIRKGYRPAVDSYSAFMENDQKTPTGLAGYMRERGLTRAVFAGLALDYCVGFSALDARKLGFEAVVDLAGCRGIADESVEKRMGEMRSAGVSFS